ncbi:type VII secretion protein EccE [Micromonospora sp. NPDC003197]
MSPFPTPASAPGTTVVGGSAERATPDPVDATRPDASPLFLRWAGPLVAVQGIGVGMALVAVSPTRWWSWATLIGMLVCLGPVTLLPGSRWHYRSLGRWRRMVRRRSRLAAQLSASAGSFAGAEHPTTSGPLAVAEPVTVAGLVTVAGPLRTRTVERGGGQVGVAEDAGGWFAVAELAPRVDLRSDDRDGPPTEVLARIFQDRADPSAIQLIDHIVGAPSGLLPAGAPAVTSYRQLVAGQQTVAQRFSWLCVRIDTCDSAVVAARHGGDPGAAARATATAMLRASRLLRQAGYACQILGERELTAALTITGLVPDRPVEVDERWQAVRLDGTAQSVYAVSDAGGAGGAGPDVTAVPAIATTAAVTLVQVSGELLARRLVRVVALEGGLAACQSAVRDSARRASHTAVRLDGRHAPAVYAAGPTSAALPPTGSYATSAAAAGLDPLDVPWQRLPATGGRVGGARPAVGLWLGYDVDRRPAVVRVFRVRPTELTLVGGAWTARVLAARALAMGARVHLFTAHPDDWHEFAAATGLADRLFVGVEPPVVADPRQPTFIVDDLGADETTPRAGMRPWQTRLTVLRRLTSFNARRLGEAQLVVLHRLTDDEATVAAEVLGMTGDTPRALTRLPDDMVALVGGGVNSYVWLEPTDWERSFGVPGRLIPDVAMTGATVERGQR